MIVHRSADKLIVSILVILCTIFIAFRQILHADNLICVAMLMLIACLLYIKRNRLLVTNDSPIIAWVICVCWMAFSSLHTYSTLSGIKVTVVFATFTLCGIVLTTEIGWYDLFIGAMKKLLCFHMLFTFFQLGAPKTALKVTGVFLDSESQSLTREWIEQNGNYAGISGQTMINAFYFVMLGGICASELYLNKTKSSVKAVNIIILGLSYVALVLTGKKGALLAVAFSIALIMFVSALSKKKHLKLMFGILVSIGVGAIFILIKMSDNFSNKAFETSVVSRERILYNAKQIFKVHPWFGSGTDSIAYYIGHSTHNIYIQFLCEYGIIGAIIFIFIFMFIYVISVSRAYELSANESGFETDVGKLYLLIYFCSFILINGFTENTLLTYQIFLPYMLLLAAAYQPAYLRGEYDEKTTK